jgi:hypothetical protein
MLPVTALCLACLAIPAVADVHVVDPAGGHGKALLQQALDAARSGDIVLLRAGFYGPGPGPLQATGKAVTIVADTGVTGLTLPALRLDGVPSGSAFVVRNIDMQASAGDAATAFLSGSDGTLWLEGDHVLGAAAPDGSGSAAVRVQGGRTVLVHCSLFGAAAGDSVPVALPYGDGGPGLQLGASDEALVLSSAIQGGQGGDGAPTLGASTGGHAIWMPLGAASLVIADSFVLGGSEGDFTEAEPGQAGDGIHTLLPSSSPVFLRSATLSGGSASTPGADGVAFNGPDEDLVQWPAAPRSLVLPPLMRSREAGQVQVLGLQGDLVGALVAVDGAPGAPLAGLQGALLVPPTSAAIVLGVIASPFGDLALDFVLPDLPAGVEGLRVFAQGVFLGRDGLTLGSGSAMAWIDERI